MNLPSADAQLDKSVVRGSVLRLLPHTRSASLEPGNEGVVSIAPFLAADLTESVGKVEPRQGALKFVHESGVHAVSTPEPGKEREPRRSRPPRKIVSRAERLTRIEEGSLPALDLLLVRPRRSHGRDVETSVISRGPVGGVRPSCDVVQPNTVAPRRLVVRPRLLGVILGRRDG